jgi:hypothetical protein
MYSTVNLAEHTLQWENQLSGAYWSVSTRDIDPRLERKCADQAEYIRERAGISMALR